MSDPFGGASAVRRALYGIDDGDVADVLTRQPELDLHDAAALGDVARLGAVLAADPGTVDAVAPEGFTALHLAAFFGHAAAVEALLGGGANVAAVASNAAIGPVQPLHSAAANGSVDVCSLLLSAGADVNARQGGGFTPLHAAAGAGNDALVGLLLAHGADPAQRADSGDSAAELASAAGHPAITRRLEAAAQQSALRPPP